MALLPTDMEGAEMLLARNALDFEAWAVTAVPGLAPNERRVGDRGIDGRGAMMHAPEDASSGLVVAQVKGGGYTASSMRDFQRVIEREKAAAGIYITLRKVDTRGARHREPRRRWEPSKSARGRIRNFSSGPSRNSSRARYRASRTWPIHTPVNGCDRRNSSGRCPPRN